jgi:superfamily II DNA helicase RecQ
VNLAWPLQSVHLTGREPDSRRKPKYPSSKSSRKAAALDSFDRVLSAVEEALFDDLKEWRKAECIHQGTLPYLIFSNKTLKAMAIIRPQTHAELENIPGVGPAKLETYGADLLRLMARK